MSNRIDIHGHLTTFGEILNEKSTFNEWWRGNFCEGLSCVGCIYAKGMCPDKFGNIFELEEDNHLDSRNDEIREVMEWLTSDHKAKEEIPVVPAEPTLTLEEKVDNLTAMVLEIKEVLCIVEQENA